MNISFNSAKQQIQNIYRQNNEKRHIGFGIKCRIDLEQGKEVYSMLEKEFRPEILNQRLHVIEDSGTHMQFATGRNDMSAQHNHVTNINIRENSYKNAWEREADKESLHSMHIALRRGAQLYKDAKTAFTELRQGIIDNL